MSTDYIFEKVETVYLNNRKVNVYDVYKTNQQEVSEIIEQCERPGVTVVTSRTKVIKQNAESNVKIFAGKAYGKTKKEAEENFFNEE